MYGTVGFDELLISCIIGDLPEERVAVQSLSVDIRVEIDFTRLTTSDDLQHTIDYVKLSTLCQEVAENGQFRLIERLADALITQVFTNFSVESVWVRIRKPLAIKKASCAVVELKRMNPKHDR